MDPFWTPIGRGTSQNHSIYYVFSHEASGARAPAMVFHKTLVVPVLWSLFRSTFFKNAQKALFLSIGSTLVAIKKQSFLFSPSWRPRVPPWSGLVCAHGPFGPARCVGIWRICSQWANSVKSWPHPVPQWGSGEAVRCDLEGPLISRQPQWIRKVSLKGSRLLHLVVFLSSWSWHLCISSSWRSVRPLLGPSVRPGSGCVCVCV